MMEMKEERDGGRWKSLSGFSCFPSQSAFRFYEENESKWSAISSNEKEISMFALMFDTQEWKEKRQRNVFYHVLISFQW